jgi:ligand-binding sensor domain-containing protein
MTRYAHIVLTILLLLAAIHTSTFSQYDDIKFEHLTIADGIPGNSVWCILQDHLGYLWLGTRN